MQHLEQLDYIAIFIYMLLMAGIGLFFKWYVKDFSSYVKGSGALPLVVATISNFMGLFSTFVFVAYAGIAYQDGMVALIVFWCTVPPCIIAGKVFAKKWRRLGVSSPVEYLETRFNPAVRQSIGWLGLLLRFLDNMVRLYAIGIFLTAVTPLSLPMSMVISSVIIISFTMYGGLWAVSIMGTIQFVILLFASIILFWLSLDHVGGFKEIQEKLPEHMNWFNGPKGHIFWLSIYYIMVAIKYNENWTMIQRFYSVKDEKTAEKVGLFSAILFFAVPILFIIPPIISRIVMPDLPDHEMAYAAISGYLLPPGLLGVMVVSMFAATMSTLTAEYNVMASVISKDIYQRLINRKASGRQLYKIVQIAMVLVGLIVMLGSLFIKDFGGAFEANKLFTGIFAIPIGIPLIFGLISKKPNSKSALYTVIFGALAGIILNSLPQYFSWELATAIEIVICFIIFYFPQRKSTISQSYKNRVAILFEKLNTQIQSKDVPFINYKFANSLRLLYVASLLFAALLFISMGIININELSGALSIASGMVCIFIGILVWFFVKRKNE